MTKQQPQPRNERHFCPKCGQHYTVHMNIPATATEPPKTWRCEMQPDDESDSVYSRDEIWTEYERNHNHDDNIPY